MALARAQKAYFFKTSYDVFLSFRGEDTRKTFTDNLYTALVNAGFRTFRDDPVLERGENIKQKLQKAIQQSRSSVIVFSKDYTSSTWCLDELVIILELKRTSDHVVLPVFYDVEPSDVRKQAENLAKVPKYQDNQSSEKLNGWRAALREVADLAGMVLQNQADGHESKFIQNIVGVIQDKLGRRVPLSVVQEKLQKKLLDVNRVLDDAEGKPLNERLSMKDWLNDLKEAVYDAEDLLQEIKTEALRQKMEPESPGSSTSTVQELVSSPPSHAFDSALINSRVEEVLNRLDLIMKQRKDVLGLEASAGRKESQPMPSTFLVKESGVYGRGEEKEAFIKLLLSDDETGNKITVIPIVGMAGIGKTTLAQLLYNDVRVKQHFDLHAWVCVSEEFDVLRISQRIYESLTKKTCQIKNLDLLQSELMATLVGKKFFFVLDDIWKKNYNQWELLRSAFESGAHGSKIIVTTRIGDVASMVGTLPVHRLMPISEQDGWLLFEKHAFKSRGVGAHSDLEEIGRQIVRKCNGLPLALTCLGGLLCSKLTVREWKSILNSEMWELPQEKSDILPSLWLSYMSLPPYLKRCFAYCSIFPKNYKFQTSELVFLWKAEDLLQPQKEKTAVEIGNDYFNDLISRSFFQLSSSYSYPQDYIMHDLINDLASFVSGEFCFRWEDSDSPNILSKTRQVSYMIKYDDDDDDDEKFEALQQAKCLRTFLPLAPFRGLEWSSKGLYEVLPKLQSLRMLKLSGYNIEELPDSVNNLKHLRHLDLSYTSIKKLPDTICTLYHLQVMLLSNCYELTELPPNFGRLIKLTHVDVEGTGLEKMPPHMGNLKDLQVLTKFVLDKHTAGDNLLELKKLQNLRGTLHISGLVHGSSLVAYILTDTKFLNELVLFWGDRHVGEERNALQEREVLEKLQPHLNLERLTIDGYGGKLFPGWSRYYSSSAIVYLQLYNCVNCISLPPLGQLPSLRELHISQLSGVVSIGSEFYYGDNCVNKPFRSLQYLRIVFMSGWQEWSHVGDDNNEGCLFPNLGELHLLNCPNLTGRLALDSFPMLKEVVLERIGFSHITSSQECPELGILKLFHCSNFVSYLDGGFHAPNLTDIQIGFCEKLGSWPEHMHTLLPSLQSLRIRGCPELECFPEGEFPSKLKSLKIEDCKKFNANSMQNVNKGLRRLTSLETLSFDFDGCEVVDSFPEERLLPSTLTHLHIYRLKLKTMDGAKWFGHLNSLITLEIRSCSALQCLPDTGLPSSLCLLRIYACPLLEEWCRKQKWEDSPKIAHIRRIEIDGQLLTHVIGDHAFDLALINSRVEEALNRQEVTVKQKKKVLGFEASAMQSKDMDHPPSKRRRINLDSLTTQQASFSSSSSTHSWTHDVFLSFIHQWPAEFSMHGSISRRLEGFKIFQNLTSIKFESCQFLKEFPDVSGLPNLRILNLDCCTSLVKIDDSVGFLEKLVDLSLSGCHNLIMFPRRIALKSVEHINVRGCRRLETLPEIVGEMESLTWLDLSGTAIKELPSSIGYLINLEELIMEECENLTNLPSCIYELQHLWCLDLQYCSKLVMLPRWNAESLPTKSTISPDLWYLNLRGCKRLREIPELPPKVQWLNAADCVQLESFAVLSNILKHKESEMIKCLVLSNCQRLCHSLALDVAKIGRNILNEVSLCSLFLSCTQSEFEVVFPGNEIPRWFSHHKQLNFLETSKLSFDIPSFKLGNKGLAICAAVAVETTTPKEKNVMQSSLGNFTFTAKIDINGESTVARSFSFEEKDVALAHVWLCYIPFIVFAYHQLPPFTCGVRVEHTSQGSVRCISYGVHLVIPQDEDEAADSESLKDEEIENTMN